jgi:hypothetical protein
VTTFATFGGATRLHHLQLLQPFHANSGGITAATTASHGHSESMTVPANRPKKQISPIYIEFTKLVAQT